MKRLIIVTILLIPFLLGCSASMQNIRDELTAFVAEDKANVDTLKQISASLKETWPFYSGCLDAISDKLSGEVINQQKELDTLYINGEWDDRVAGKALVLRCLLTVNIATDELERLLPGFLKLLSPLL